MSQSIIKEVSVYRQGAYVSRQGKISLKKGQQTLVLDSLPNTIIPSTVVLSLTENIKGSNVQVHLLDEEIRKEQLKEEKRKLDELTHHENEIAQSECANGCKFVNYWLHNGFVTINKEKMSKSLGNFLTIDDLLKKYDSNTIRFFILTNHYRMPVEFSDDALTSAQAGVKRMLNAKRTPVDEHLDITQTDEYKQFTDAMDDDLNTSKALAVLFDLTGKANKGEKDAFTILYNLAGVLGFTFDKQELSETEIQDALAHVCEKLEKEFSSMDELIAYLKEARDNKNWDIADKIRNAFDEVNIVLKDTKDGTIIERK